MTPREQTPDDAAAEPSLRPKRRGRRPAGADTRAAIVDAARTLFVRDGYDAVSIRAVARHADVDPALVHHYFSGKSDLFVASIPERDLNPATELARLSELDPTTVGAGMVRVMLALWDGDDGEAFTDAFRRTLDRPGGARPFREFISAEMVRRLRVDTDDPAEADRRAQIAVGQLLGMAVCRYVFKLPAFVEASPDELAARVGSAVQRCLDGQ